ncbi:MAG: hypothetical protein K6F86_10935 [Lachnospiraceae bacterium]|nr:hypothetical protein [Lachnospiraceae bacterium]
MGDSKNINILDDDVLDNVSGGVMNYNTQKLNEAGVDVQYDKNGIPHYYAVLSTGKRKPIKENVASSMADCYAVSGNNRLTDQQIMDLIRQC